TMGYNQAGMKDGVIDYLLYWMGQQENPRIADHPSYFIPRIILYEPVSVVFGVLGFVFYMIFAMSWAAMVSFFLFFFASLFFYWNSILTDQVPMGMGVIVWGIAVLLAIVNVIFWNYFFAQKSSEIQDDNTNPYEAQANETWRPDGVRIFLIYWSVLSILIYAGLNEKVPWLMVHQVLPLVLLAGVFIGDLIDKMNSRAMRYTIILFVSIFVVYEARTNIILNFYNPDDPRESIVYTQSSHQVKEIAAIVDEGARLLGREYLPPNPSKQIVAMHSEGTWPLYWYFRRYYPTGVAFTDTLPPKNIPYVITDTPLENRMKVWGEGKYIKRRFPFRINWPYGQAVLPFAYFTQRNEPQGKAWEALWEYIMYRKLWGNLAVGGKDMLFYRREPLLDPEQSPAVPKGYDQPVRPLLPLGTVGGFGTGEGQFNEPRGVILSPDGSLLYVLDGRNARIQVFDKNLKYLSQFGGPGLGKGQFKIDQYGGPNGGMAIGPDGKIYVTDTWADGGGRINVYTAEGQPLDPILSPPGDSFYYPRGVAVDSRGLIYVADTGKHRVVQYNPDGSFKTILGANAFTEPVGITAAHDGKIYICDVGGQRVVAFTPQGTFFRQWQILGWNPGDMALSSICPYVDVDRQGNIYVTDATTNTIHKISQGGDQVVQAGSAGNTRLNGPKGIVVDQNNNLFIADSLNNRIIKARIP
ncbi:hypothetical protein GF373_05850, partial [bacterium]|nr:hypothetical protein [bacterium]